MMTWKCIGMIKISKLDVLRYFKIWSLNLESQKGEKKVFVWLRSDNQSHHLIIIYSINNNQLENTKVDMVKANPSTIDSVLFLLTSHVIPAVLAPINTDPSSLKGRDIDFCSSLFSSSCYRNFSINSLIFSLLYRCSSSWYFLLWL